jgi:nitrite reductase/ring-hydroxylating ferredoxin subunit
MNRILSDKLFRTIPNAPEQIQNIFRFNACLSPFVEITCIYTHTFDILFPFLPFAAKMKLAVLASVFVGAAAFAPNTMSRTSTALSAKKEIKPKLAFVPCISKKDIPAPGTATSGVAGGLAICIAADEKGTLYALGDKCPPIGQPLSFGSVKDGCVIDPVLGTRFNLKTGQVEQWCPSGIGKLVGGLFEPAGVPVYPLKAKGDVVEVQVDVNYKFAYEQQYWSGILDAQGKDNGKYY